MSCSICLWSISTKQNIHQPTFVQGIAIKKDVDCREDVQLDLLEFKEDGNEVRTKWRFNALLQLPWKPRLAAAGGTKHVIDQVLTKSIIPAGYTSK